MGVLAAALILPTVLLWLLDGNDPAGSVLNDYERNGRFTVWPKPHPLFPCRERDAPARLYVGGGAIAPTCQPLLQLLFILAPSEHDPEGRRSALLVAVWRAFPGPNFTHKCVLFHKQKLY